MIVFILVYMICRVFKQKVYKEAPLFFQKSENKMADSTGVRLAVSWGTARIQSMYIFYVSKIEFYNLNKMGERTDVWLVVN